MAASLKTCKTKVAREYLPVSDIPEQFCRKVDSKPDRAETLTQEIARIKTELSEALPVEKAFVEKLTGSLEKLGNELFVLQADKDYLRIDMGFNRRNKWSDTYSCAVPLFALYKIDSPTCRISCRAYTYSGCGSDGWWGMRYVSKGTVESDPPQLKEYNELPGVAQLAEGWQGCTINQMLERTPGAARVDENYVGLVLSATFTGGIPSDIRKLIVAAQERGFDDVLLAAEAQEWTYEELPQWSIRDPLVIARKGDLFWYLDRFNPTDVEKSLSEWTSDCSK